MRHMGLDLPGSSLAYTTTSLISTAQLRPQVSYLTTLDVDLQAVEMCIIMYEL